MTKRFESSSLNAWLWPWTGHQTSPSALVVPHPASLFLKAGAWPISRQVRRRVSAWWWASATTAEHTIPFRADEQRLSGDSSAWTARWNIHATDRGLGNHSKLRRVLLWRRDGDNYQSEEASAGNKVRLTVQLLPVRSQPAWKVVRARHRHTFIGHSMANRDGRPCRPGASAEGSSQLGDGETSWILPFKLSFSCISVGL